MKGFKTGITFCVAVLFALQCCGQTGAKEWLNKTTQLLNTATYNTNIKVDIYAGGVGGKLSETNLGSIKKGTGGSAVEIGTLLTIQNSKQTLMIDSQNLEMILVNRDTPAMSFDLTKDFDKLSQYLDTMYITSDAGGVSVICLYKKVSGVNFSRIDTKINTITGLPSQITIYYNNTIPGYDYAKYKSLPVMQLTYSNWKLNPEFTQTDFNIAKYLVLKNSEWVPTNDFKNYELTILN